MAQRDIIVIGASAGGVEALSTVVSGLAPDLPASIFIVLHMPENATSLLPKILGRRTSLSTVSAVDGHEFESGHVYIAPPDYHLLLRDGYMVLSRGPKENHHRPAVDPLFRSAARVYGQRVIGVILSGALDDGATGLSAIKNRGGIAIVQQPDDCVFPGMPLSALEATQVDACVPASAIGQLLGEMSRQPIEVERIRVVPDDTPAVDEGYDNQASELLTPRAPASVFTCPECHGTLFEVDEEKVVRYRCRVGHGFSPDSLIAGQSEALEAAVWIALRSLEERTDLARRLAQRAQEQGHVHAAERFSAQAREGEENAGLLRRVLSGGETSRAVAR
jgi:two-component system chemotaxis response regulator CheB